MVGVLPQVKQRLIQEIHGLMKRSNRWLPIVTEMLGHDERDDLVAFSSHRGHGHLRFRDRRRGGWRGAGSDARTNRQSISRAVVCFGLAQTLRASRAKDDTENKGRAAQRGNGHQWDQRISIRASLRNSTDR